MVAASHTTLGPAGAIHREGAPAFASALVLTVIAGGLFAVCLFAPAILNDGDTWSHLATGDWILARRAVPRFDPFSLWAPAPPWTAHEWLSETLFALAYSSAGWNGVVALTGLAAAAAALVLGLRVSRDLSGAALAAVVLLGVGLWAPTLLARPHVLALPIAAAWCAAILSARDAGRAPPLALAVLMVLWSNLHGGFMFGLALLIPFALEAVIDAPPGAKVTAGRAWAAFAGAAALAALVNPYGVEALAFPFRLMGVENLSRVGEWQPENFSGVSPFEVALLALLALALTRPLVLPPLRAGLLVLLIAEALAHARHAQLLGLLGPMLLAPAIARAIGAAAPERRRVTTRAALLATAAVALCLCGLRFAAPLARNDGPSAPLSALAEVPADVRALPVLNDYGFGGYLIWSRVRPFIDGRADMYGGAMLALYGRLAAGDPATVETTLAGQRIAWTIFPPDAGIVATLDREPGWRRLYADAFAVVHVRDPDRGAPALRGE